MKNPSFAGLRTSDEPFADTPHVNTLIPFGAHGPSNSASVLLWPPVESSAWYGVTTAPVDELGTDELNWTQKSPVLSIEAEVTLWLLLTLPA